MENIPENENPGGQQMPREEGYVPRPAWQVWAARIGLVAFIFILILYYRWMLGGGF